MKITRRSSSSNVLKDFIIETIRLYEAPSGGTTGTSASTPTSPGLKATKDMQADKTAVDDEADEKNKSFTGKSLKNAKELAVNPPIGAQLKNIAKGPGRPQEKIANTAKEFGSLIAQMLPKIDDLNPQQVTSAMKNAASDVGKEIETMQKANKELSGEEEKKNSSNPLLKK